MWELVDNAREAASWYRRMMRLYPHDPYYQRQVRRHLERARHWLMVQRKDEDAHAA